MMYLLNNHATFSHTEIDSYLTVDDGRHPNPPDQPEKQEKAT
jgi:hypothetical protein